MSEDATLDVAWLCEAISEEPSAGIPVVVIAGLYAGIPEEPSVEVSDGAVAAARLYGEIADELFGGVVEVMASDV